MTHQRVNHYEDGKKVIAFKAGYRELIRAGLKSTTVRLLLARSYKFTNGEVCVVKVGPGPEYITRRVRIVEARCDLFGRLLNVDLIGESPDSESIGGLRCVLGNLSSPAQYITNDTPVQILKFVYID